MVVFSIIKFYNTVDREDICYRFFWGEECEEEQMLRDLKNLSFSFVNSNRNKNME